MWDILGLTVGYRVGPIVGFVGLLDGVLVGLRFVGTDVGLAVDVGVHDGLCVG